MTYSVKEMFYTLQGEGAHTGRAALFIRFAGCNLWNGFAASREFSACTFCDTDFVGINGQNGGKFATPQLLVQQARALAPSANYVVLTGGEPLLQVDEPLLQALHAAGFAIAVESNGTIAAPQGIDYLCISPKANVPLQQTSGHTLKLVYPQADAPPPEHFATMAFKHFYVQPMAGDHYAQSLQACIAYCMANPQWRLSLQTHKIIGID